MYLGDIVTVTEHTKELTVTKLNLGELLQEAQEWEVQFVCATEAGNSLAAWEASQYMQSYALLAIAAALGLNLRSLALDARTIATVLETQAIQHRLDTY